ncbi:MAG: DUF2793 domain-containing protein [Rhizobiales bacterium]|nr:DUF2793 domain-containing protein [Hyphomicrobiales bacterium]
MSDTIHLALPFLEAAQAQKHVTVNEALRRLDALVQLAVASATLTTPPATPADGARYIVGAGAGDDWAGHEAAVAAFIDGAWMFLAPEPGWRAFDEATGAMLVFTGSSWVGGNGTAVSPHGATSALAILEADHVLSAGASNDTALEIPDRAIVLGVTGRVIEAVTGATSWNLGVAADATRYGNGIGAVTDSTVLGVSGTPTAYYGATPLRLTAVGGDFTGGTIRLAIHYWMLSGPAA